MVLKMYGKTEWEQSPKIVFSRSIQNLSNATLRSIFVQIRKDLLPDYKRTFEEKIKALYTIKKVVPVTISPGKADERESFELRYSRIGNPVQVEIVDSISNVWFIVNFVIRDSK